MTQGLITAVAVSRGKSFMVLRCAMIARGISVMDLGDGRGDVRRADPKIFPTVWVTAAGVPLIRRHLMVAAIVKRPQCPLGFQQNQDEGEQNVWCPASAKGSIRSLQFCS